jgi:hypothetical protein
MGLLILGSLITPAEWRDDANALEALATADRRDSISATLPRARFPREAFMALELVEDGLKVFAGL